MIDYSKFIGCIIFASVAFAADEKTPEADGDSLRIVGDPARFESISKILTALFVESENIYKLCENLARTKPSYPLDVGIGIGAPKAVLYISKRGGRSKKIIELYDKKDGLVFLREISESDDPSVQVVKSLGWFQDKNLYELTEKEVIRVVRGMVVDTGAGENGTGLSPFSGGTGDGKPDEVR